MNSNCLKKFHFDNEAKRFNLIANYLDDFAATVETLSDNTVKEKLKLYISQIENLVLQSPEWIYNNGLPGINIGIFGAFNGGWKEVLSVFADNNEHDYIEDMGIRVKHVIKLADKTEYLLLIRHESENMPNMEFSHWVDCGIFVFKLENEHSYKDALLSHKELISLRSNDGKYVPMILVGCRDGISPVSPRLKSFVEMKDVAQQYGFDEYIEVRYRDGYNTFFLFEFCTLLAHKYKSGFNAFPGNSNMFMNSLNSSEFHASIQKRKSNKRKTCIEEDFKTPTAIVGNKKLSKSAKRNSSISDPPNTDNERRRSITLFKTKTKSLPRTPAPENSSSFSSNSSLSEQHSSKAVVAPAEEIVIQGILYKGGNKKWVTITNKPKMFYHNSKHDFEKGIKEKEIELKSSNAKVPGNNSQNGYTTKIDKRKPVNEEDKRTITIDTHLGKYQIQTRVFKASSEEERNNWIEKIKDAIFRSYSGGIIDKPNQTHISPVSVDDVLSKISTQYGNDVCADCNAKNPKWVVYNFGILVCDRCAGGHRKLSTDISKVCSSKLDSIDKIKIKMLELFGNTLVNSVMEAKLHLTDDVKPTSESPSVEDWLHKKYILRKYKPPLPLPQDDIQKQLIYSIQEADRRYQLICLMNSTKEQLDLPYDEKDSRTALMIAARVADIVAVQLLLWAGVNTSIKDKDGLNAHSFASINLNGEPLTAEMIEIQNLLKKYNTPVQILQKLNC